VQFTDLVFGDCDQLYACKRQVLVKRCYILLVTRKAVERFRNDDVEFAGSRILEQLLIPRPHPDRATDRAIGVGGDQSPALLINPGLTGADLIFD